MMTMNKLPRTTVIAGIIFHEGKILIGKRAYGVTTEGLWEFPGGKMEANETPEECLKRECIEELGLSVTVGKEFDRAFYPYPDRDLDFIFLLAKADDPNILSHPTHTEIRWISPAQMKDFTFCPADKDVIVKIMETFA